MAGKEKQPLKLDELGEYISDLRSVASALSEIQRQMEAADLKSLDVMGQSGSDRGLVFFDSLLESCRREMKRHNIAKKRNGPSR